MSSVIDSVARQWTDFVAVLADEMRPGLKKLGRIYKSDGGPHEGAAGENATALADQLAYRQRLHKEWRDAVRNRDDAAKIQLVYEQVDRWGGIRRNHVERMKDYASHSAPKLIGLGQKNISSWSKALSIRDPRQYAIYDARAAMTLNALQVRSKGRIAFLFPVPPTQNTVIDDAKRNLRRHCDIETHKLKGSEIYTKYLAALKAAKGGHSLHRAELYLYHRGPELAAFV